MCDQNNENFIKTVYSSLVIRTNYRISVDIREYSARAGLRMVPSLGV